MMAFSKIKKDQTTTLVTFIRWKSLDFTADTDCDPRNNDAYPMLPKALTCSNLAKVAATNVIGLLECDPLPSFASSS